MRRRVSAVMVVILAEPHPTAKMNPKIALRNEFSGKRGISTQFA
jgi:hypothetical protein